MSPVQWLVDEVADIKVRRAAGPLLYQVVHQSRPTGGWVVQLDGIPEKLKAQAEQVVKQGNREAGRVAYSLWSYVN